MGNEKSADFRQLQSAPVFDRVKRLLSDRHYRDKTKLFFAEGIRNFVEAVDHNFPVETIIYSEKLLTSPIARKMVRELKRQGTPFVRITPDEYRQISVTERASGVAAIFRQPAMKLNEINPREAICWTAVSSLRSPGNLGTLIRTSAAIAAGGFILIGDDIDPFAPNVVRPTMGAIFKQKIARASFEELRIWTKHHKLHVIGASPGGTITYDRARYNPPTVLLLGNERTGLTENEQSLCSHLVRIPMADGMDSLNVAVAGSLLLYEIFRYSRFQLQGK
ncbi:RNA methyltransferase [Planktothrix sp. FACHB-1355]|uniref:TrmH family RNA methyltransferase n=1 Tax=Planktothrix sp. FACHB-1355 TaxID=2692854 RepID=UPI00168B2308|nr:RNA methyltransferase [Planktothrix sp. FACHB-1355]MBD3557524.1 RNA methyltransferase [Planktothrix sp. FACHB-1355]MBD3885882.1 RNA methyltransferase [Phormidium tenue FACHB-886]